jgi:hypothetical protein
MSTMGQKVNPKRWVGVVAMAAALVGAVCLPSASQSQTAALDSFGGTWVFSGGQAQLRSMDDSLNRVVDQMNLFIREIARSEIHRRIDHEQRVRLVVHGERAISLGLDDWGPIEVPLNGGARSVEGPDGDRVRASAAFRNGRLIWRQVTSQGSRVNAFTVSGDGSRLGMGVTISAGQLPADIRYRLSYRRVR